MDIYRQKLSEHEIKDKILEHHNSIKSNKKSRFNQTVSLIDGHSRKVLDYGCGWGSIAKELYERGHDVTGIDLIANEIEICRRVWGENEHLKFKHTSILDINDASFDVVISNQVIEHVHNAGTYLSEINRVLVDQGELVITLPNVLSPKIISWNFRNNLSRVLKKTNQNIINGFDKRSLHINAWDPLHFTHLVSTLGFELMDFRMSEGLVFPFGIKFHFPFFKNNYYTMCFKLKKVKRIEIKPTD
ncbi:MAG: class I SAM-dependent methyltransferase [Flavobacteriaceae bacterium]